MVAIWGLKPLTDSIEGDRALRLSTGATVDLSSFTIRKDKKPSDKTIADIVAKVQASMDHVEPQLDLPLDDPERSWAQEQFAVKYGARRFLDGAGNIVDRSTLFSLIWDNGRLVPRWEVVR